MSALCHKRTFGRPKPLPVSDIQAGLELRGKKFMRVRLLVTLALIGVPRICDAQTPANDLAAQVCQQGYSCDQPITAIQDVGLSKADSAVWVLKCRNATYRMRLHPDMAAGVTKLKRKSY